MPLMVAPHAGFCMGVRRAVQAAEKTADSGIAACTLGQLIHNTQVVDALAARGISPVDRPEDAGDRTVLIRSHGVSPDTLEQLRQQGTPVMDLTCPFVSRLHDIVAAQSADGTPIILVGEKAHPEVVGTAGWAKGPVYVVVGAAEV